MRFRGIKLSWMAAFAAFLMMLAFTDTATAKQPLNSKNAACMATLKATAQYEALAGQPWRASRYDQKCAKKLSLQQIEDATLEGWFEGIKFYCTRDLQIENGQKLMGHLELCLFANADGFVKPSEMERADRPNAAGPDAFRQIMTQDIERDIASSTISAADAITKYERAAESKIIELAKTENKKRRSEIKSDAESRYKAIKTDLEAAQKDLNDAKIKIGGAESELRKALKTERGELKTAQKNYADLEKARLAALKTYQDSKEKRIRTEERWGQLIIEVQETEKEIKRLEKRVKVDPSQQVELSREKRSLGILKAQLEGTKLVEGEATPSPREGDNILSVNEALSDENEKLSAYQEARKKAQEASTKVQPEQDKINELTTKIDVWEAKKAAAEVKKAEAQQRLAELTAQYGNIRTLTEEDVQASSGEASPANAGEEEISTQQKIDDALKACEASENAAFGFSVTDMRTADASGREGRIGCRIWNLRKYAVIQANGTTYKDLFKARNVAEKYAYTKIRIDQAEADIVNAQRLIQDNEAALTKAYRRLYDAKRPKDQAQAQTAINALEGRKTSLRLALDAARQARSNATADHEAAILAISAYRLEVSDR